MLQEIVAGFANAKRKEGTRIVADSNSGQGKVLGAWCLVLGGQVTINAQLLRSGHLTETRRFIYIYFKKRTHRHLLQHYARGQLAV